MTCRPEPDRHFGNGEGLSQDSLGREQITRPEQVLHRHDQAELLLLIDLGQNDSGSRARERLNRRIVQILLRQPERLKELIQ